MWTVHHGPRWERENNKSLRFRTKQQRDWCCCVLPMLLFIYSRLFVWHSCNKIYSKFLLLFVYGRLTKSFWWVTFSHQSSLFLAKCGFAIFTRAFLPFPWYLIQLDLIKTLDTNQQMVIGLDEIKSIRYLSLKGERFFECEIY